MRAVNPAIPEKMEHWSKTSVLEPQPLGKHKGRKKNDDAGASRGSSGKFLKLLNVYLMSRKISGDFSGGEATQPGEKPKRREREDDDAGAFHGGSGKYLKTTNASPASRAENGGFRSSGGEEMRRLCSASHRESTNVRRDWPSGKAPNLDHRTRNISALSPPREGSTTKRFNQESKSKTGMAGTSLAKKTGTSTSLMKIPKANTSLVNIGKAGAKNMKMETEKACKEKTKCQQKVITSASVPIAERKTGMEKNEKACKEKTKCQQKAITSAPEQRTENKTGMATKAGTGRMTRMELEDLEWRQARKTVAMILNTYRRHCKDLEEDKSILHLKRVDRMANKLLKKDFPHLPKKPFIGAVPGIKVGEKFAYRLELHLVCMHRPLQCGIDTTEDEHGDRIAISVVDSGKYENYMASSETLIYCAQGSSVENQKEKTVNQAMIKSNKVKNPVRVIKTIKAHDSMLYFYDGLYTVEGMWEDRNFDGSTLKFKLVRIPGEA